MTENGSQKFIKELYSIEQVLMEAQKKVFQKRLELQSEIQNIYNKGASTLTQIALTNPHLYKTPIVPSIPKVIKRTEIIDLEHTPPARGLNIQQKTTGRNQSRNNENNQQETSIDESEIQYLEQVNRELEEQNSEIEIELDVPNQMKQILKDEKNLKKKQRKDVQAYCPVCSRLLSSKRAVQRHLRQIHKMANSEVQTIRIDKLSQQKKS